jgi:hypothetical protein
VQFFFQPGETLEEYCRRVPNVWSPCSKSTDTVDCDVAFVLEFAHDAMCEDHKFTERPMLKIVPADSDYRLEQDWLDLEERVKKKKGIHLGDFKFLKKERQIS